MTEKQFLKNLSVPEGKIDVVLDTDAFNEADDQYAIAYMLRSSELNPVAIYAAPFHNEKSVDPKDGMEKSYNEILHILELAGRNDMVCKTNKGSDKWLDNEKSPVISPAAEDLAKRAMNYSPESPLYVAVIGAITNIASAVLINPEIIENIVVVWLGGNAINLHSFHEFNMCQDLAAARVVMGSGVPFIQLPCRGVVSSFTISKPELEYWLIGKNPLADYVAKKEIAEAEAYASGAPWTRVIWDVTPVAWLINREDRFMCSEIKNVMLPGYDGKYHKPEKDIPMCYVNYIDRDALMGDLIGKLLK